MALFHVSPNILKNSNGNISAADFPINPCLVLRWGFRGWRIKWRTRWKCRLCTEVQAVYTLSEGKSIEGVTSLREEIYLLRGGKDDDQVEVYDISTYSLLRCLTVPNARSFTDMTSCKHSLCLYIGDDDFECVHRLDTQGKATVWQVNDVPQGLSVNAYHSLIVTCWIARCIKELSPRGISLRDVTLPDDVINPWHAIQLTNGQFIVCHGEVGDPLHRVCKISSDGRNIINSHSGQRGSNIGQYDAPRHLAVDDNEFVFVVDANNSRVTLLSPTLDYKRQVVSRDQVEWRPSRLSLCYDVQRPCLYVVANEVKEDDVDEYTVGLGRVVAVVFSD